MSEELSPLDPSAIRLTVVSGEFEAREAREPAAPVAPPRARRCPRSAEPTWQIPRRFSPVAAVRRVFGPRR